MLRPSDRWWILGLVAAAFVLRLVAVVAGPGLRGDLGYDDGVYLSAAAAFAHGALPYRDYPLFEAPGIVVALAPFGMLARVAGDDTALAIARLAVMALGSLNVGLAAGLGWRWSRGAGIAAGVLAAAWPLTVTFDRSTMLQTPQATLLLAALLVLTPMATDPRAKTARRLGIVGGLLGLATAVQLWNAAPVLMLGGVVAWWSWRARRRRREAAVDVATLLGAATAAFAIVVLPFALVAAGPMLRMAVIDQLQRPDLGIDLLTRLRVLEGGPATLADAGPWSPAVVIAVAGALAVVCASVARLAPMALPWVLVFGVQVLVTLVTPVYFEHYAAWPAVAAIPALGVGVAQAAARLRTWSSRLHGTGPRIAGSAAGALALAGIAGFVVGMAAVDLRSIGGRQPASALARAVAGSRCVASNRPVLLLMTNSLQRSLDAGCPLVVDPTGTALDLDRGRLLPGLERIARLGEPGYQAAMAAYFGNADAVLLSQRTKSDLTPATQAFIDDRHPRRQRLGSVLVLLPPS